MAYPPKKDEVRDSSTPLAATPAPKPKVSDEEMARRREKGRIHSEKQKVDKYISDVYGRHAGDADAKAHKKKLLKERGLN